MQDLVEMLIPLKLRMIFLLGSMLMVTVACANSSALVADDHPVINLWPGQAIGEKEPFKEAEGNLPPDPKDKKPIQRLARVSVPTLTVYEAPADKRNGTAVIVAPGGGYHILAWDLEGTEIAEWLNSQGVTAFLLKYRVPQRPEDSTHQLPLHDAQRAVSLVRSEAEKWKIQPDRVGMLGFSAGGNLTAKTCTQFDKRSYDEIDKTDNSSCRPDFAIMVYSAWMHDKDHPQQVDPTLPVTDKTPPMFLVHAADDPVHADSSIAMFNALRKVKVPAELHVYGTGGHGYGMRPSEHAVTQWPLRANDWLKSRGLLNAATPKSTK